MIPKTDSVVKVVRPSSSKDLPLPGELTKMKKRRSSSLLLPKFKLPPCQVTRLILEQPLKPPSMFLETKSTELPSASTLLQVASPASHSEIVSRIE